MMAIKLIQTLVQYKNMCNLGLLNEIEIFYLGVSIRFSYLYKPEKI